MEGHVKSLYVKFWNISFFYKSL